MRFPRTEVYRLLSEQFEQVEIIWDNDPYDEVNAFALTIKEFMRDRQIQQVDEGVRCFVEFKLEQTRQLAAVGLANGEFSACPRSQDFIPQPA